jgi:hypothetical protein
MRTKTIGYIHAFNVQGFLNDKAIIEVELNEGDDEDLAWDYVLNKTKEIADRVQEAFAPKRFDTPHREEPSIQLEDDRKKTKQSPEEKRWEAIISACCSEKEVEKWRKKVPESLTHLLDKRLTQLKPVKQ